LARSIREKKAYQKKEGRERKGKRVEDENWKLEARGAEGQGREEINLAQIL